MSKQFGPKNKTDFIENPEELAKELFGYDDETLLRELKEAELELEQMKAEDSELETQIQAETEAGFEALMQKIHAENIKPVTEREYSEKKKEEERKVIRLKPVLKVMFVAAAILVVLSGMGSVVSARKEFEYQKVTIGEKKNEIIWRNGEQREEISKLETAYGTIEEEIGINVIALGYMPSEMRFDGLSVDKGHALIKFLYNNNSIYLKEIKYPVDKVSDDVLSDRIDKQEVYNSWLGLTIAIEENIIDGTFVEYSAGFEHEGAYYYLAGVIDEIEFTKMIESLHHYQK